MTIRLPLPEGTATFRGESLVTSAFAILNLLDFLPQADRRGENHVVPDVEGEVDYGSLRAATEVSSQLAIAGDRTLAGDLVTGGSAALWGNAMDTWDWLHDNLVQADGGSGSAGEFVFARTGGVTYRGDVQLRGMKRGTSLEGTSYPDGVHGVYLPATIRWRILLGELVRDT